MISYKPGQVILVPFPFTDFTTVKQRPALIVSSKSFNQTHDDVIIVAITSKDPHSLRNDEFYLPKSDQKAAGLPKPSKVKTGKIVSIHQQLIRKQLGRIPPSTLAAIMQRVIANFHH
jgi:mRNA interferase MazF